MRERIVIKNFSVIDDIDIELKKISVLIGPQASGKSLIAKLVYFFKTIHRKMHDSIISGGGLKELNQYVRSTFSLIFPDYLLEHRPFEVTYYYGDKSIKISNDKGKRYKSLKILYSSDIRKRFEQLKQNFRKITRDDTLAKQKSMEQLSNDISRELVKLFFGKETLYSVFIPAGRSFFINVEKNIFTLLSQSVSLDYMLKEFGTFFQDIKNRYSQRHPRTDLSRELYKMCTDLLGGEYGYYTTFEWLTTNGNKRVFLKDSSSGQQELVPLVVPLMVISQYTQDRFYMFIEEPETHLFPESQKMIVEIIGSIYNLFNRDVGFFITTHSPYILTSFNNLIQAENTHNEVLKRYDAGKIDAKVRDDLEASIGKVVSHQKRVPFDDVSVYLIKRGKAKPISDLENKLIDAGEIDVVSNTTACAFDKLLEISFGDIDEV